jgi:hypothetical protein
MVMERKSVKEDVKNGDAWIPDNMILPSCGLGSVCWIRVFCSHHMHNLSMPG